MVLVDHQTHTYDTRQLGVFVVDVERLVTGNIPRRIVIIILP
jgi:hypothetical protein